jgi:hypothetical protein
MIQMALERPFYMRGVLFAKMGRIVRLLEATGLVIVQYLCLESITTEWKRQDDISQNCTRSCTRLNGPI